MKACKICGRSFDDENCVGVVVNEDTDNKYFVYEDCVPDECSNGHIISCEDCDSYFTPDRLHDKRIRDFAFAECPACGKDIVEYMSRGEFEEKHSLSKYSVTVRMGNYSHGYIISAQNPTDMMKKLMCHTEFCPATEISYSGVLMGEDVVK